MTIYYSIPEGQRVYAIGDIHGEYDLLQKMHENIAIDMAKHDQMTVTIVYLGDYVDRGLQSYEVLDDLCMRHDLDDGVNRIFLLGNHEKGMLTYTENVHSGMGWLEWGGLETLKSYGVKARFSTFMISELEKARLELNQNIPQRHLQFLNMLKTSFTIGDFFFAHAGVNPSVPFDRQNADELIMIREPFLSYNKPLEKCVVHGHTIYPEPQVKPHRIGIDTGAHAYGTLTALVLEGNSHRFIQVSR